MKKKTLQSPGCCGGPAWLYARGLGALGLQVNTRGALPFDGIIIARLSPALYPSPRASLSANVDPEADTSECPSHVVTAVPYLCSLSCLCVSQSPPGLTLQREHTDYVSFLHQPARMLPALPRCLLPDLPPLSTCRRGTSTFLSGRFRHERSHPPSQQPCKAGVITSAS